MARLTTIEWHTPPPTSVDEVLVLYDDGTAVLGVRRPRHASATVGRYVALGGTGDPKDRDVLIAAGPGPHSFDLLHLPTVAADQAVLAAADRVAEAARENPYTVVTFGAGTGPVSSEGLLPAALLATGAGTDAVEFELDPPACSAQFLDADGQAVAWVELPPLEIGFMTPDAEGLGGVVQGAHITPGVFGAIAIDLRPPAGASQLSFLVAGWLSAVLPDEPRLSRFEVRTDGTPIPV